MKYTTTSGTGKNLSSEVTIDTFTASADIWLAPQLRLSNLNASAATLLYVLRHTTALDVLIKEHYFSQSKRAGSNSVDGAAFLPFLVKSGEKVAWRQVSSNSSDTNASWSADWVDAAPLQPTVAGRTLDVAATGEAGLDFNNRLDTAGILPSIVAGAPGGLAIVDANGNVAADVYMWLGVEPATLTGNGHVKVDVLAVSGDAIAADRLEALLDGTGAPVTITTLSASGAVTLDSTLTVTGAATFTSGIVGNITGNLSGSVGSVSAGVSLADNAITTNKINDGAITSAKFTVAAPSGLASGILEKIDQIWRRWFKKSTMTASQLKTLADDGTTVLTTQALTDDGTTQTQGAAT